MNTRSTTKTNENVNTTLLHRELAAAQARITELDAEVADKDNRIKILRAKVNSLEEKANERVYERYFGGNTHEPSNNDHHQAGYCCDKSVRLNQQGCWSLSHSNPCFHQCPSFKPSCFSTTETYNYPVLMKQIQQINSEMKSLRDLVSKLHERMNIPCNEDNPLSDPRNFTSADALHPDQFSGQIYTPPTCPPVGVGEENENDSSMTSIDSSILQECPLNLN